MKKQSTTAIGNVLENTMVRAFKYAGCQSWASPLSRGPSDVFAKHGGANIKFGAQCKNSTTNRFRSVSAKEKAGLRKQQRDGIIDVPLIVQENKKYLRISVVTPRKVKTVGLYKK